MTPEEQRIAIAVACGWKKVNYYNFNRFLWVNGADERAEDGLPDYLNDLNAMHEAETTLNCVQIGDYENKLYGLTEFKDKASTELAIFWSQHSLYRNAHSTAAQRAEAFLKTIGKWE